MRAAADLPAPASLDWQAVGPAFAGTVALTLLWTVLATLAWHLLLDALGAEERPLRDSLAVFLVAQFAKYIPGNVAHQIGRVALATRIGLKVPPVAASMVIEAAMLLGISGLLGLSLLSELSTELIQEKLGADVEQSALLLVAATGLALVGVPLGTRLLASRGISFSKVDWRRALPRFAGAFGLIAVSIALFGLSAEWLCYALGSGGELWLVLRVMALALIGGYLVPGAPAGIGVREMIILALLTPAYGAEAATAMSLLLRIACIVGDALIFGVGLALAPWRGRGAPDGPPVEAQAEAGAGAGAEAEERVEP